MRRVQTHRRRVRRRCLVPDVANCRHEKGATGAHGRFGLTDGELGDRLIAQEALHVARSLRAGHLEESFDAVSRESKGHHAVTGRESQRERNLVARTRAHQRRAVGETRFAPQARRRP